MQRSLFDTLSTKIDAQIRHFRQTYDVDNIVIRLSQKYDNMKQDLETRIDNLVAENTDLRSVWDNHMANIRNDLMEENETESINVDDNEFNSEISFQDSDNIENIITELNSLKETLYQFDVRLIECESYPRRESLVISGIPSNVHQNRLESVVLDIMHHMGLQLVKDDISACHRLFNPPGSRYPARVIVRFVNRKVVDWCLSHQENLKYVKDNMGLNLRVFESLSAKNSESLKLCKHLLDNGSIYKYYTRNGFPKVIENEGDNPMKICHPKILRDKFGITS